MSTSGIEIIKTVRRNALKIAIHDVLRKTDKVLSDNDLVIILSAACADLPNEYEFVHLPSDYEEALALVAELRQEEVAR